MPQILSRALLLASFITCAFGCSDRFRRSKYDPFAGSKRGVSETDAGEYPELVSPGNSGEITQAGREFDPRQRASDRYRSETSAESTREPGDGDSSWASTEAGAEVKPAVRVSAGVTADHAPDYSWLQGRLEYTHLCGGIWRVRYAPLSADDKYGGCVILQTPPSNEFKQGDLVFLEGRIVDSNVRGPLPNPIYQVSVMNRVQ
jgi:hypothetical protein